MRLIVFVAAQLACSAAFAPPGSQLVARRPVAQFGKKSAAAEQLPKGWRKVPSRSRPGEFSFENIKTRERFDKLPVGSFYDDERDTVSKPLWDFNRDANKEVNLGGMTDAERSGFTADGRDLASAGSEIYFAFIPFLLLAFAYSNGIFSFGYADGNFNY